MIKAVLFDFDETLQDRTEAFLKYARCFMDDFMPNLTCEEKLKRIDDMVATGGGGYVDRDWWYPFLIEKWGWQNAPDISVLKDHYIKKLGDFDTIFDNSAETLKQLKKRGYKVGIITNGPSYLQNHKLDNSGLRQYLDVAIVGGDFDLAKPDKQIFDLTAKKLNVKNNECVYVGDHPINDIEGALNSGMSAIRMNWGWFKNQKLNQGVPVIDDIIDVLKYV